MAGIAAAVTLADAGHAPLLIESRPYIGGRARSFLHPASGDEIDNGQHLMMGCYRSTFGLLERLGTRDLVEVEPSLRVEFRDRAGKRTLLDAPRILPSPLDVLAGMLRMPGIDLRERLALLRLGSSVALGRPRPLETVAGYLDRLGQTRRLRERLWDPLVIATLNTPPDLASAGLFVEVMRRAFLGRGDDSHLAFPIAGLSRLLEPARDYIESRGGSVITGAAILAIERDEDGFTIHLKERQPIVTRHIVSALPERSLRRLAEPDARLGSALPPAGTFAYAPIVSLYLWYDAPLGAFPKFAAMTGTAVQWVFNRRTIVGGENGVHPGLLSCTISAAFEESMARGDAIAAMADGELRGAFPEMGSVRLADALVVKEKHATFLATPATERLRPGKRTAVRGFYLAGDWTATGLPGTIEGAVTSGVAAARALIEDR